MTKRLTKVVGCALLLLFIGGTIILPAYHRAHRAENHARHEASTCPICPLANALAITTSLAIVPIVESIVSDKVDLHVSTLPSASLRDPTQARAPPVA